ncbi:MAG: hypothetical protein JSU81_08865 [Candidatus Coatesbacteria bacterium]|nr:MAG: hypothetical protein JSU81_08865 [Candidatus Coatesbacteria bacterium]
MVKRTLTAAVVVGATLAVSGAAAEETAAYLFGMVGVFAGDYESDEAIYEKVLGVYEGYGIPAGAPAGWGEVELSTVDFAASPFGFGIKGEAWRAAFVSMWNRHEVEYNNNSRQVNNATLTATGGYILRKGYFEDTRVAPYFGGFWRGNWTKGENVENGVLANGFGPDVGAVIDFDLNNSFAVVTVGYQYKVYMLTGPKSDDPTGNGAYVPQRPHWNYGYIPENEIPGSGAGFFVDARGSLQFHRRVGAEVELRYDLDLGDSFVNGLTFAAGPSLWL